MERLCISKRVFPGMQARHLIFEVNIFFRGLLKFTATYANLDLSTKKISRTVHEPLLLEATPPSLICPIRDRQLQPSLGSRIRSRDMSAGHTLILLSIWGLPLKISMS